MPDPDDFPDLIRRIRAGDADAAADLVQRYEPLIRREIRLRLDDRRLNRAFDASDVCQSVLASFFVRTAAGQFDLEEPDQLRKLLLQMARNKLASSTRAQTRQRRDHRRVAGDDEALGGAAGAEPTPSRVVAGRELLDLFRARLNGEELQIADLRAEGRAWGEVAELLGGTAQARRMQFVRAVERVAADLGLDAGPDEES